MLKELPYAPLEGALNTNVFVGDELGKVYLQRNPRSNKHVMEFIAAEQDFIGFREQGGGFRRRTPVEQVRFIQAAAASGLRVLMPAYVDERDISYYPFLSDAQTMDTYLPQASVFETEAFVFDLFKDLRQAHRHGFIYGDRWSENILMVPDFGVLHIDFDIEIYGQSARELEVAQVVFYTLCGGRDKVMPLLAKLLAIDNDHLDMRLVERFAMGLALQFLDNKVYGNATDDVDLLFKLIDAQRKK